MTTTTPTSGATDLLDLIEAYAEARHRQGRSSYNAQTAAALQAVKDALAAGQATAAQAAQAVVQDDLITIRKPTTSAEMLWLLKLAHLVISDVGKTLEETFAPAQPAAEPSRFGSPELQAMIIARCVEKDQADSVQEDAARWNAWSQAMLEVANSGTEPEFFRVLRDTSGDAELPITLQQFNAWIDTARTVQKEGTP